MTLDKSDNAERIAFYDNMKFAMITLVVVGHLADMYISKSNTYKSVYLFIYAFHMPMLIFLSGLFYSDKNNKSKVLFYIISGFILKICLALVDIICGDQVIFSILSDDLYPWFLFSLAIYQVILHFIKDIDGRFLVFFSILLACFAGYDLMIGDFLYLSRVIIFLPFYLLGTILDKHKILLFLNKYYKKMFIPALLILLAWFYMCFCKRYDFYIYRPLFTGRNPFDENTISYGPLARLFCYAVSFLTCTSLLVLIPKRRISFFSNLGMRTINVYFWHMIICRLFFHFVDIEGVFFTDMKLGKILLLLMAVPITICLSGIKIFDYPLNKIKQICFAKKECG